MAKHLFIGKYVVSHLHEGPEGRTTDIIEKPSPSVRFQTRDLNIVALQASALPLCYNRYPSSYSSFQGSYHPLHSSEE